MSKKKGAWEIRVYLLTSTEKLDYSIKFPKNQKSILLSKEEKAILEFVTNNREEMILNWENIVCVREKNQND